MEDNEKKNSILLIPKDVYSTTTMKMQRCLRAEEF